MKKTAKSQWRGQKNTPPKEKTTPEGMVFKRLKKPIIFHQRELVFGEQAGLVLAKKKKQAGN
jgi:hypothetical protein